jgi:hypothetical protein
MHSCQSASRQRLPNVSHVHSPSLATGYALLWPLAEAACPCTATTKWTVIGKHLQAQQLHVIVSSSDHLKVAIPAQTPPHHQHLTTDCPCFPRTVSVAGSARRKVHKPSCCARSLSTALAFLYSNGATVEKQPAPYKGQLYSQPGRAPPSAGVR